MRIYKAAVILLNLFWVHSYALPAQTTVGSDSVDSNEVTISIAPSVGAVVSSANAKVLISITNQSKGILVHVYPIERGSIQMKVVNPEGVAPPETEVGCKKHMSVRCGPNVKLGGEVSFTAMVVMPGEAVSFEDDLAKEYNLEGVRSITVDAIARDFVLVDAPPSISGADPEVRRGYLLDYKHYSYKKLAPFHSNSITLQFSRPV